MNILDLGTLGSIFPEADTQKLSNIQDLLDRLISEYLNTTFGVYTYEETDDSSPMVILHHMPIVSVTEITDLSIDPPTILTEGTDYFVYPSHISIPDRAYGQKNLKIKYKAGFETIPALVQSVAEEIARYWAFRESEGSLLFYKSQSMDDRQYAVQTNLSDISLLKKLRRYKQVSLDNDSRRGSVRLAVI